MTEKATIREKGQLTIPANVRSAAAIEEGDLVEVEVVPEGILLRRCAVVPASQTWFWTKEWQAGEREASEELAAGRGTKYDTAEAFLASLDA